MAFFSRDKKLEVLEQQKQKSILYKQVFLTESGKQVLFDLMDMGHILTTHKGDQFQEGRRSMILDILHLVNVKEEQFQQILEGETA